MIVNSLASFFDSLASDNVEANVEIAFRLSLTAGVILLAVILRYIIKFLLTQSSQFSHKQLVLVATPVSTGVYLFVRSLVAITNPIILPIVSAMISPISKERFGIKYFCTNSIAIP